MIIDLIQALLTNVTDETQIVLAGTRLARLEVMEEIKRRDLDTYSITNDHITKALHPKQENPGKNKPITNSGRQGKDVQFAKTTSRMLCKKLKRFGALQNQQLYPSALKQRELLKTQVTEPLKDEVIEPSSSPWSSPVILILGRRLVPFLHRLSKIK